MKNIAVFVSGGGTNLQAVIDGIKSGKITNGKISLVLSSKDGVYAIDRAKENNIPVEIVLRKEYPDEKEFSEKILEKTKSYDIDLIILAGFMSVLSEDFIKIYENKIINVHPTLIPAFCGKGFYGLKVHEKVLERGVKLSGATVHFVNEVTDGGPIILQKAIEVKKDDTPETLQKRVMTECEQVILAEAVNLICNGRLDRSDYPDYPGRGIIIGQSADGDNIVTAYFIMGRSENSRNRIFEKTPDGIRTKAFDESKLTDPSLVIYSPIRKYKNNIIVTNGDQTDTIYDFLSSGKSFEEALRTRTFEPDPPILTPRISGIITIFDNTFSYKLSILKSDNGNENHALRYFYEYETPEPGKGHFIHTYKHNADIPPSFEGEPKKIEISDNLEEFADTVWNGLSDDYKVSLYVSYINIKNGEIQERIINKNV